ncbi:MAG TPA: SGNH/GDSL hydrolase family protein [Ktedonobacterales bacterium]
MRQADRPLAMSLDARVKRGLTFVGLSALLVAILIAVDVAVLGVKNPLEALSPHYYMALGDSLSFGYQPNLDFSAGFVDDLYNYTLRPAGATGLVNDACAGETTETMINGGCVARFAHHGSYTGAQLDAALRFLNDPRHKGRVSPVTLEIGVNDVIKDWDPTTCSVGPSTEHDLATMDTNLTTVILPKLIAALATPTGASTGDLHLLNYYNPYAQECADSVQFVHELNDHLAADAAQFRIPVVDVYNAFGGDNNTSANLCSLTWMCNAKFHDIHPSNKGYAVIAQAVEKTLGLPGTNPVSGPIAPPALPSSYMRRTA